MRIARELFQRMEDYVAEKELPWTPALRANWLGYRRAGGYYVAGAGIQKTKPVEFWVKIRDDPQALGLADPYPELMSRWDSANRQWAWTVPSLGVVPDVTSAIEISRSFQPSSGPMAPGGAGAR